MEEESHSLSGLMTLRCSKFLPPSLSLSSAAHEWNPLEKPLAVLFPGSSPLPAAHFPTCIPQATLDFPNLCIYLSSLIVDSAIT